LTFAAGQDPENDTALGEAIEKHGRVVLSGKFVFHRDEDGDNIQSIEIPIEELLAANPALGYVNMATDSDDVVRRPSLVDINMMDIPIPSLALATVMAAEDLTLDDLKLSSGRLEAGKHRIPINKENRALATFYGPMHTFKTISYADVIEGVVKPEYFKDNPRLATYFTKSNDTPILSNHIAEK
jgi:adenylate cyclase